MTGQTHTILLMGLPRSGTTWLGKIFDSHPDTFYSHEPDSASRFRGIPLLIPPDLAGGERESLLKEVRRMRGIRTTSVVGKLPLFPKSYVSGLPLGLRAKELFLCKALSRGIGDFQVPKHVVGTADDAPAWAWKSIESSGRLGAIARALPESRAIFIIRHPCGVAASTLRGEQAQKFIEKSSSEDWGFFESLSRIEQARSRGLSLERFREMSPIVRMAWRWALLNEKTLEDIDGLGNCMVLRYEDLCEHPEKVAREMFAFAGLAWSEQTEGFLSVSTRSEDTSYYSVVKDPKHSAHKWREQLPLQASQSILETVSASAAGRLFL
jgi:hypothetical protein